MRTINDKTNILDGNNRKGDLREFGEVERPLPIMAPECKTANSIDISLT